MNTCISDLIDELKIFLSNRSFRGYENSVSLFNALLFSSGFFPTWIYL